MRLRHLELQTFRNFTDLALELSPGFNFFYGVNGAGKTAILEAVHVLARGRSFRTQHAGDLIQIGQAAMAVRATAEDEHQGVQRLVYARSRAGGTEVRINGDPCRRMSQISALLPLEVMTPSVVDLVFGGPGSRREWLDWGVFHVKHDYLAMLRRYVSVLRQRNAALKSIAAGRLSIKAVEPWTLEISRLGVLVSAARAEHLLELDQRIASNLASLNARLDVEISYRRGWPEGEDLADALGGTCERDVKSGATAFGPHRADVELRIQGQHCSVILSRGEAKVLASALMITQSDVVRATGNRIGLFLIDDLGAELDAGHRRRLFQALLERGCQVLATSAEPPEADVLRQCSAHSMFHVEQGRVAQG